MNDAVKLFECPRDAMQGIKEFIPTEKKVEYLNALLKVGFDTLDFGSFVSPKAVPQLVDTAEVLAGLDLSETKTKLLAIVANFRGANDAAQFDAIHTLGYPFSISETFQLRNTKKTISESVELVKEMQELAVSNGKDLLIYLSMGFGNPYGEEWSPEIAEKWAGRIADLGVKSISLADTIGCANPENIAALFDKLIPKFPEVTFGAHFHSTPDTRQEKLQAAWDNGCRQFDSAIKGFGGCMFAKDELVGNMSTEAVLEFLDGLEVDPGIDREAFERAIEVSGRVF